MCDDVNGRVHRKIFRDAVRLAVGARWNQREFLEDVVINEILIGVRTRCVDAGDRPNRVCVEVNLAHKSVG